MDEVELVDPLQIKLDPTPENKKVDNNNSNKQYEINAKRIKFRLTHEKKTIVFMMHTCRKVRNLAKYRKQLDYASDILMFGGMLLLRKGQRLNEKAIASIKNNEDIYGLNDYKVFTTSKDSDQILGTLMDDEKLYNTLLSHLQKKLEEEVDSDKKRSMEILSFVTDKDISIDRLNNELTREFSILVNHFKENGDNQDQALKKDYAIALSHMYLSQRNEVQLPFLKDGHIFDWKEFENSQNQDYVNNILKKASDEFKK